MEGLRNLRDLKLCLGGISKSSRILFYLSLKHVYIKYMSHFSVLFTKIVMPTIPLLLMAPLFHKLKSVLSIYSSKPKEFSVLCYPIPKKKIDSCSPTFYDPSIFLTCSELWRQEFKPLRLF